MEMMNRMMSDALDSQSFVDRMKALEIEASETGQIAPMRVAGESRTARRARERSEAKAAKKAKA